jgi:hypothetical protein
VEEILRLAPLTYDFERETEKQWRVPLVQCRKGTAVSGSHCRYERLIFGVVG